MTFENIEIKARFTKQFPQKPTDIKCNTSTRLSVGMLSNDFVHRLSLQRNVWLKLSLIADDTSYAYNWSVNMPLYVDMYTYLSKIKTSFILH